MGEEKRKEIEKIMKDRKEQKNKGRGGKSSGRGPWGGSRRGHLRPRGRGKGRGTSTIGRGRGKPRGFRGRGTTTPKQ